MGTSHVAYLHHDGTVSVCAYNLLSYNQTGNAAYLAAQGSNSTSMTNGPVKTDDISTGVDIVASGGTTWVLLDNNTLACWGQNSFAECSTDGTYGTGNHATTIRYMQMD